MKRIITVAFFAATLGSVFSCTKLNDTEPGDVPNYTNGKGGGREDDDKPIVMHRLFNELQQPVQNVSITMTKGPDTLYSTTDSAGQANFYLPDFGAWEAQISCPGYRPVTKTIDVRTLFSITSSTLRLQ